MGSVELFGPHDFVAVSRRPKLLQPSPRCSFRDDLRRVLRLRNSIMSRGRLMLHRDCSIIRICCRQLKELDIVTRPLAAAPGLSNPTHLLLPIQGCNCVGHVPLLTAIYDVL
ncbi:unnamed protein product [Urochloa humidicola]